MYFEVEPNVQAKDVMEVKLAKDAMSVEMRLVILPEVVPVIAPKMQLEVMPALKVKLAKDPLLEEEPLLVTLPEFGPVVVATMELEVKWAT